jgi:hypothetical protein
MAKRGKQERIFDEKQDPEIVRVADRYIELRKESKLVKEKLEIQEKNLIGLMRKATKPRIEHGGYVITLSAEVVDKIKVKEPKKFDLS